VRIAFVPAARLLSEREPNGEALIATSLMRALAARGHEILAYCERSTLEPIDGVEVREVSADGPTSGLGRLGFAKRIAADAARERFDVAHLLFPLNTNEGYTFVNSAPLIAGPINLPWPGTSAAKPRLAARIATTYTDRLERRHHARTTARAARLLVTGASSRAAFDAEAQDRITEIPFGVDVMRFTPAPLPGEPTILFLSVLQERKGIEVLLRAMPHVERCMPRARLVVAGSDPHGLRPRLEAMAADLGIAHLVEFAGPVAPQGAPVMYARATVVCQPSFGEPFGMTVIEAMASGRAVVGTADGGIPDAVLDGRGGRLVHAGDARLLADALCDVLATPGAAERMGAHNRERAETTYALWRIVDRIEDVYEQLAGDRKKTHVSS